MDKTVNAYTTIATHAKCPKCDVIHSFDSNITKESTFAFTISKAVKTKQPCIMCGTEFFVNMIETIKQKD